MSNNFESQFSQIDDLLYEINESAGDKHPLTGIDDLCSEIDSGLETQKEEISKWPDERKREEAMNSEDQFVLNLLSMDKNFNVRILSACNPKAPANSLRRLVENGDSYVRMVIANNPNSSPDILDRIFELSNEQEVLNAVKYNGNISPVTKYKIENRM